MNRIWSSSTLLSLKSSLTNEITKRTLKSDLKIKWRRPKSLPPWDSSKSGDLSPLPEVDMNQPSPKYAQSPEYDKAPPEVQKKFQLQFRPKRELHDYYKQYYMDKVQGHMFDENSEEVFLARLTAKIRFHQILLQQHPRNGNYRRNLSEWIQIRSKMLGRLREKDYKRFEYVLEKLDLYYKPQPDTFIMIARKEGLRQLTRAHCNDVKETRLQEYRRQLEAQQLPFLAEKLKNLEFIRKEQQELGITVTVSQKQIDDVRKQYEELKEKRADESGDDDGGKRWKAY